MKRGSTDAETCRLNGWVVGTRLVGEERGKLATITITAIGRANVLAIRDGWSTESVWSLSCREWRLAPDTFARPAEQPGEPADPGCGVCARCRPAWRGMYLCATCGNKRCPHATDCRHACTGSNEPGQRGSMHTASRRPELLLTPEAAGEYGTELLRRVNELGFDREPP